MIKKLLLVYVDNICVQNELFPSEADEPPPGDVAGIEGCREWAEFWMVDGVGSFLPFLFVAICICILLIRWLSSITIQSQKSVTYIAPWKLIVRQWGDPGLLLLLNNAL